ncbi:MAG: ribosome small subunit-dependent GTPase A [bacterium]
MGVVGDFIDYSINEDGTGTIENIFPRNNYISRKAPRIKGASYRGERLEQIIASNIDNLFIVTSITRPDFNNRALDRILVTGESSHVKIFIIINKSDLDEQNEIAHWKNLYEGIGYEVIVSSVKEGIGLDEIHTDLRNKTNLFWGSSGVGKSSILNNLFPHFELRTGEISDFSGKGIHTTVTSILLRVEDNTYLIDTPGVREIDPYGLKKEDLGHYFVEFAPYLQNCRFSTCTHDHEPGCGIFTAVEQGSITKERYDSYLKILNTIEDDMVY